MLSSTAKLYPAAWRVITGAHHGVDKLLLALAEDGDEPGLLVVAARHGRDEVDSIGVVVVVADIIVLPPAGVTAALRGCGDKTTSS